MPSFVTDMSNLCLSLLLGVFVPIFAFYSLFLTFGILMKAFSRILICFFYHISYTTFCFLLFLVVSLELTIFYSYSKSTLK